METGQRTLNLAITGKIHNDKLHKYGNGKIAAQSQYHLIYAKDLDYTDQPDFGTFQRLTRFLQSVSPFVIDGAQYRLLYNRNQFSEELFEKLLHKGKTYEMQVEPVWAFQHEILDGTTSLRFGKMVDVKIDGDWHIND